MVGPRRKARMIALQALYEIDSVGHDPELALSRLVEAGDLPQEVASFSRELIQGVVKHKERLDALIGSCAPSWPVAQLLAIDRNILRIAIFEILIDNKVPMKAAITEAVELAKAFGSASSPRFINGVLGAISARSEFKLSLDNPERR